MRLSLGGTFGTLAVVISMSTYMTSAGNQAADASLVDCPLSGNWSEWRGNGPADGETNIFVQYSNKSFTVTNYPKKWWQNGYGTLLDGNIMGISFDHDPYPDGPSTGIQGKLAGSCENLYVFFDNDSVWCKHQAVSQKCGTQPPSPYPPPPDVSHVTIVHVIQACHLDVGFADSAAGIINRYFTQHFPKIIEVAEQLRNDPSTDASLQFMAQSYVISLYLSCPEGMGIDCPTPDEVQKLEDAIKRGDITYHAFPFNAELALLHPSLISEGFKLTHSLDDRFGFSRKSTLSQRDVPGMPRSIIPLALDAGVTAISVGVNGASMPPNVPKAFTWVDQSGQDIIAMWHPRGYGGIGLNDAVVVPGVPHALVFDWNGDNAGPYSAEEYKAHFKSIQAEFPNATIVASTFDNFTQHLAGAVLPKVTQEIGDTWIYGVPSDPHKASTLRAFNRAYEKYLGAGKERDAVYLNATRLLLKMGEHTWGKDVKSNLHDNNAWSNEDFHKAKSSGVNSSQYGILEDSWWEQRAWGIDYPLQALKAVNHPLLDVINEELQGATAVKPDMKGYKETDASALYPCALGNVQFSPSGAMTQFSRNDIHYASKSNLLFELIYRIYSQADFTFFIENYMQTMHPQDWAFHDFGKPNDFVSPHATFGTTLQNLYKSDECTFRLRMTLDSNATFMYGGPEVFWADIAITPTGIQYSLDVFNKTATRMPEAMFLKFDPIPAASSHWEMDKLGTWTEVNNTVEGGSPHLHAIKSGVKMTHPLGDVVFEPIDAPVISLGASDAFPIPCDEEPDMSNGVSSVLWDNLWGTNYIMWIPFAKDFMAVPEEAQFRYRYNITFGPE